MKLCVLITLFVAGAAELQGEQFSLGSRAEVDLDGYTLHDLGCWKDTYDRAVPSLEGKHPLLMEVDYRDRTDAVEKCVTAALSFGCDVIAVQNGGWCGSSQDAIETYKKYGETTTCKDDGKGGGWGNRVYQIITNPTKSYNDLDLTSSGSTLALEGCLLQDVDFTGTDILETDDVVSAEECLELCSSLSGQDGCKSMAFDEAAGSCHLKNTQYGAYPRRSVGIVSGNLACARLYASSDSVFTCDTFGLKSAEGKWLSAQADGSVEWNRDWYRQWEMISFEPSESDSSTGYFRSTHGKYLSAQADLTTLEWNRDWMRPWEEFTVEQVGDKVAIKSTKWGLYISSEPAQQDTSELFSVHPPECLRSFIPPTTAPATASPNVM